MRARMRAQMSRFSSSGSSERSSMWELNSGRPVRRAYSSPWAIMPSTQGISPLLAWSVCSTTHTP